MADLFRESPFGQVVRLLSGNRLFKYPEEQEGFTCPHAYDPTSSAPKKSHNAEEGTNGASDNAAAPTEKLAAQRTRTRSIDNVRTPPTDNSDTNPEKLPRNSSSTNTSDVIDNTDDNEDLERRETLTLQRTQTLPYTNERLQIERRLELERTKSKPIVPTKTADGTILVDWYHTDDPANPQNWSQKKKAFVAFQIDLYTFVVYCGSAIYVSSELGVMQKFGVGNTKASLGLALYVLGYGLGPLLWAPMSEIPMFGRNVPYVATFAIYLILCVPTALVNNLGGLLVLRFLQGFFGSPCLANGGATMQDMYSLLYLPYSVALWVSAAFAAPALGPMLSGFAVTAKGWRWSLWEILWMSGPVFILWFFCLPETSAHNILLRRAARLRAITSNEHIRSQTEIDRKNLSAKEIFIDAVIKPVEITIKDPAVLFTNVYTALTYGIYYSFFEVFPLVYGPLYGFNLGVTGVVFTCIVVGCFIAMGIYGAYLYYYLIPDVLKNGLREQEWRLRPALIAVFFPTIGLFLFGWTARSDIHWIAGVIGITMYASSVYIVLQCIFVYIPMSYPQYAASLFAGNDFCRSAFAFGAILFSRAMFLNLGIGKGVSLLGGLSVLGIIGMWLLYFNGAALRKRSKFAI